MPQISPVTAVLGPTNTGKTHLAVERMLAHGSGMIGLPLRLLAREVYDKVRLRVGDPNVALVTGEEKIIPANPRFWVATVEAMPPEVEVAFLAIDEIQVAADLERGHIFTDRILHRRGREETMLLGAATMRPIVEQLLPGVTTISRPRFSKLTYSGQKKMTRLPRRTAIVAFSAEMVYAVAELIRRQRGGAAVVLGALSPRTRNAQVGLYQSGDVDYVVATDAIGMGLNMDVDHVAFAATRKFDGFQYRQLNAGELGQIAGRAGRYMNDGTFGVTGEAEPFDNETVERLENHSFEPVRMLQWRNRVLDFSSLDALRRSLTIAPRLEGLTRAQAGPDMLALESMLRDEDVARLATTPQDIERLWDICQIPDYRNISPAEHAHLVSRIFQYLMSPLGHIPEEWIGRQLELCERTEGDIDTLSTRISHVRTWTYVANRGGWLYAPAFWQQRAKEIEDKLSDALHERLTQRFIDRRSSVLLKRLARKEELMSSVEEDGTIRVEGEAAGRVAGLRFIAEAAEEGAHERVVKAASLKAVAEEIAARAQALAASADPDLKLNRQGEIVWQQAAVGRLAAGPSHLKPRIEVLAGEELQADAREAVQARLEKWLGRHIAAVLEPLVKLEAGEGLEGISRGIAFRLVEHFGVLPRDLVASEVKSLSQDDRAKLRTMGARFGAFHIFVPALLKPGASELRLVLWALGLEKEGKLTLATIPSPPGQGLTSAPFDRSTPRGFYGICGYRICGDRVVRVDMLERLADLIRERVFWRPRFPEEPRPQGSVEGGGFTIAADMMSLVGCSGEQFQEILKSLGFRMQKKVVKRPVAAEPPAEAAEPVAVVADEVAPEPAPQPEPENETLVALDALAIVEAEPEPTPVAAEMADVEIEVWWPKDTGPFSHVRDKRPERPERPKRPFPRRDKPQATGEAAPAAEGEQKPERRPRPGRDRKPERPPRPEKPARVEKPADPDSPFAVLSALKERMTQT